MAGSINQYEQYQMHRVIQTNDTVDQVKDQPKKESFRPLLDVFLFIAFLASLALYFNQDELFTEPQAILPTVSNDITIDDLLLNKTGLIDENVDRFLKDITVGYSKENVIDKVTREYINRSYESVVATQVHVPKNIHIYEVVDYEEQTKKINALLKDADQLFEQDKLTTPEFENAFSKYEYVLTLDPNNKPALEGIKNIVNRYVFFIDKVIEKNEEYKVPILIENVRSVGEGYVDIRPIFDKYKDFLSEEDLVYFHSGNVKSKNTDRNKERLASERSVSNKIIKADYQITEVAIDLIKNNKPETALKMISDFVALYPGKSQAYDLLLQIYLDQGDSQSAENIIYQNVQFESVYLAEKTARIFISRGEYESALTLLESHQADFKSNPDYYYLLAGLYIKLDNHEKAQGIYERLLVTNRYNAYYWFGLAVALQAQGHEMAMTSFSVSKKIAIKDSLIERYYQYRSLG